jgi:hypothetical protein
MDALTSSSRPRATRLRTLPGITGAIRTIVLAALAAVLIAPSGTVTATIGWCKSDPLVQIGPNVVDIILSAPLNAPLKVTGPNEIVIIVPETVSATAVRLVGFGQGEVVSIDHSHKLKVTEDGIEVVVRAFVPSIDDTMPVVLDFAPNILGLLNPASAQGFANTWITLETVL